MQMDGDESSNIEDRRDDSGGGGGFGGGGFPIPMGGGGGGGGVFTGGLGVIGFIVVALLFGADPGEILGGITGGGAPTQTSAPQSSGPSSSASRPAQRPAADPETQFVARVLKSTEDRVDGHLPRHGQGLSRAPAGAVPRRHADRVWRRPGRNGTVLLSCRPTRLSRPRLFRRVGGALPRARPVPAGLCHRPRDRPPRPEPARHLGQGTADAPEHEQARRQRAVGADRTAGRLLCRRLGQPRRPGSAAAR